MSNINRVSFNRSQEFFETLRSKDNYLKEGKKLREASTQLYIKGIILISLLISIYTILVFFYPGPLIGLLLCALLGLVMAGIGFNIMHDGAHGSYSKKAWLNELTGYSLNLMGGNVFLWKAKHNINHHTYTNIDGMDDDIDIRPFVRVTESQPLSWYHKFQHIYWAILYSFTYLLWIYVQDFRKYFSGKVGNAKFKEMDTKQHVIFWSSKAIYLCIFIIIPAFKLGFLTMLIGYLFMSMVCGFVIAVVFQLAHVVGEAHFPEVADEQSSLKIEDEWAIHQIKTTANFATKSRFIRWFTGGLNHQVEHHLFPKVPHTHYPKINEFVKETCKQFNVPYQEFRTLGDALRSHIDYLKRVGHPA